MQKKVKSRSQVVTVLKSLSRNKMAILGLVILILLTLMAIFAPYIAPYDYAQQDLAHQFQAPSAEHWFGTDEFGRDVFSRIVYGTRVSLLVGFVSVGIALLVGGSLGAIAGFYGKRVDNVIMRVMDVLLAIPQTLLAIAVAAALGSGLFNLMIAVGISSVPTYARIVRASVMTIRGEEYIEAATASGTNNRKIILKHILPNCVASSHRSGNAGYRHGHPDGCRHELYRPWHSASSAGMGQHALNRTRLHPWLFVSDDFPGSVHCYHGALAQPFGRRSS